ncbi:MAG: LPS export ABC transporter permease LptG [Deltaproteobacteria bacterium]|nr:LPS export ABC transporter permease LptG [Candidatus Anaeroferrophillacea bacterium]
MRIYRRYLIHELLAIFTLSLLALLALYMLLEFFGSIDDFIEHQVGPLTIIRFIGNRLPFYTVQFIPFALLLGTMLTLGSLSQHNELIALRACGLSARQLAIPLLIFGLGLAAVTWGLNEFVVPPTFAAAEHIETTEIEQRNAKPLFKRTNVWYTGSRYLYHFHALDPAAGRIEGATLLRFDEQGFLESRVDAAALHHTAAGWQGTGITTRRFSRGNGRSILASFSALPAGNLDIAESPADFTIPQRPAEEMSSRELRRHLNKTRKMGMDTSAFAVQLYHKFFYPLACPLMVLLGIPFSWSTRRSGGMTKGIGISLIIGFSFWIALSFSLALGKGGVLAPATAALLPHLLYGAAGGILVFRTR